MPSRLSFSHGGHRYYLADGAGGRQPVKSVSGLLKPLGAGEALLAWATRVAGDYAADQWEALAAQPVDERRRLISGAAARERDAKANAGKIVHAMAEALLRGESVDPPESVAAQVQHLARWLDDQRLEEVRTEVQVWADADPDLGACAYAGTADLFAVHPRWGRVVMDWKTGAVYPQHGLQVMAYGSADWLVDAAGNDVPMPHFDAHLVVQVAPHGVRVLALPREQRVDALEVFALLRQLANCADIGLEGVL
jgi:hypothetical protein